MSTITESSNPTGLFTRRYNSSRLISNNKRPYHSLPNLSRKTKNNSRRVKSATELNIQTPVKKTLKKKLRIYSPLNKTRRYILDTPEKNYKKTTPVIGMNRCVFSPGKLKFPCVYQKTVFENYAELESYLKMKKERNESTGYKTKREHYAETAKSLKSLGMRLKKSRLNMM